MQNFGSEPGNNVSPQEAEEILATWANRRQVQGVDPSVNSVPALAAGLGVSEEEVRSMLEDIRVQKRSREIAAGILDHQQQHRKRSDINAAIVAAVVVIVLLIGGGLAFAFLGTQTSSKEIPSRVEEVREVTTGGGGGTVPGTPAPPSLESLPNTLQMDDGSVIHTSGLHGVTNIEKGSYIHTENGNTINLTGKAAATEVSKRIEVGTETVNKLKAQSELSKADQAELNYWEGDQGELRALTEGQKLVGK